jgi:NAD(P)-dependent dehydrogenase (short-subunit alcohol dehydrogenase family)
MTSKQESTHMAVIDLFDLTGKVALITGGSRGLGRQMALAFAEQGADVIVTSRSLESCEEVAAAVEAMGRQAMPYACHVGHWDELEGLVDAAYNRFGKVDVLVNNAGKSPLYPTLMDVDEKMWDSVIDVNLKGPFRLAVLVGTRMAAGDGGSIINVSSSGSLHPGAGIAPYGAAKRGLNALTEALALGFGPTVRVNTLMPGPYLTDISKAWDLDAMQDGLNTKALKRAGNPDEIIGAALFLASNASSYTTGSIVRSDGH